jgi:hypothetical protein
LFEQDTDDTLRFQKEVYITQSDTLTLYRSLEYISIYADSGIDFTELNELVRSYNLQPVSMFNHLPFDTIMEQHMDHGRPVVLKVPKSRKVKDLYSGVKANNTDRFGNHPLLVYSLPVYAFSEGGAPWFYITNELILAPTDRLEVPESIAQTYKLEFLRYRNQTGTSTFRITDFSIGTPYEIAHEIKLDGDFRYVTPNAFAELRTQSP